MDVLARGVLAGLAGTLALSAFEVLERRLLGRDPLYSPKQIALRLASRFGARLGPRGARWLGRAARALYGPSLGVAGEWLDAAGGPPAARIVRHGCAISAFELAVMPAAGAAPPLGAWPISDLLLLVAHASAFAAGAELAALVFRSDA